MRIKQKLFLAIFMANLLSILTMFAINSLSFKQGFLHYINEVEIKRFEPFMSALVDGYKKSRQWDWILIDHWRPWQLLIERFVLQPDSTASEESSHNPPHPPPDLPPPNRPALGDNAPPPFSPRPPGPAMMPLSFDPRLQLLDAEKNLLIGTADLVARAELIPLEDEGKVIGYLGYLSRHEISSELDLVFFDQQKQMFLFVALGGLLISVAIALPLAGLFANPIRRMAEGTQRLAAGYYDTQFKSDSADELGNLTHDLNNLAQTLQRNKTARQQWFADISHELRTPLSILKAEVEALQDGIRPINREAIDLLHIEIEQLNFLVSDLSDLALSDIGALNYDKQQVDLVGVIHYVIDQSRDMLLSKGIAVEFLPAQESLYFLADQQRLMQLFSNLLQNTLRYTAVPGNLRITVIVKQEVESFWDETTQNDKLGQPKNSGKKQFIEITWCDSKPGVSDEDLPRLFDRLFRVETSRNRHTGGSGLGLAIGKNIVEAHGGRISAYHSPHGGLGILIIFPL